MTCPDAAPMIAAAADGPLEPERLSLLEAHLETCASCREAFAGQQWVAGTLAAIPPVLASEGFVHRVRAGIDREGGWLELVDFRAWTLRLVPAAAALLVVAYVWAGAAATQPSHAGFHPSHVGDWQADVSANALLEAALKEPDAGVRDVR